VNCRVCVLAIALQLLVVTICKCIINPSTNPNSVYSHGRDLSPHATMLGIQISLHLPDMHTSLFYTTSEPVNRERLVSQMYRSYWYSMYCTVHVYGNRGSAVGIATGYGLDDRGVGVQVLVGSRILSSPQRLDRPRVPPSLLSNGYRRLVPRG
jgi:hypothetical protein